MTDVKGALFVGSLVLAPVSNVWGWYLCRRMTPTTSWRKPAIIVGLTGGSIAIGLFWSLFLGGFLGLFWFQLDLNFAMGIAALGILLSVASAFAASGWLRIALIASGLSSLSFWLLVSKGVL